MRPVIVFCATEQEARDLADAMSGECLVQSMTHEQRVDAIGKINSGTFPRARMLATTRAFCTGWRAPQSALVVFLDGFSRDAVVRAQAMGRVGPPSEHEDV